MRELTIGNRNIQFFTSIKELPIDQSKKFNAYLLQDAGIGNTIEDVDIHLEKVITLLAQDKKPDAVEELKNMRFNLFSMLSQLDYKSLAFGCLIKGLEDYGTESIAKTINELSAEGLSVGMVQDILEEVKKKWTQNGQFTFPNSLGMI